MNDEKIFCGSGKIIPTQYGELTKISFSKEDINKMVSYMKKENSDWVNLVLKEKQNKVEGKPTHYLTIDTWKPNAQMAKKQYQEQDSDTYHFS